MQAFKKCCAILAVTLAVAFAAPAVAAETKDSKKPVAAKDAPKADANEIIASGWRVRCQGPEPKDKKEEVKFDKKVCEGFQRLDMKANKARLAEFAIGFPDDKELGKGEARGVVVLPLGILLEQGVAMKIDDKKPVGFKIRYCQNDGCFGFMTLDKDLLSDMRKGKTVTFVFKTFAGQDVNLIMSLEGIEPVLKQFD